MSSFSSISPAERETRNEKGADVVDLRVNVGMSREKFHLVVKKMWWSKFSNLISGRKREGKYIYCKVSTYT